MTFRPSAVPLITVDPYFSIWSFADQLSDDVTRHWTGQRNALLGLIKLDGKTYRFMGKTEMTTDRYSAEPTALPQTSLRVEAMTTTYVFENEAIRLNLRFMTPLLLDDLAILSRPVSYISYDIESKDGKEHQTEVYFEISGEAAVDRFEQKLRFFNSDGRAGCGHIDQKVLHQSGDDTRIDWGYLHLTHPNASVSSYDTRQQFLKNLTIEAVNTDEARPATDFYGLYAISDKPSDTFVVAYDDIKSIVYFGEELDAYYKIEYGDFESALAAAIADYDDVRTRVEAFEAQLRKEASKISAEYGDITALAYRQAIAAHKLVHQNGEVLFLSKECYSNGCIATLDVTYPSTPLFLRYNPELVKGMLRPIFKYGRSEAWPYDFAPHDTGQYPLSNGQVYGNNELKWQMPVEECGNALIASTAVCHYEGNNSFLEENRDMLDRWADYLLSYGYDPGNQLCTDDFAGHLAHNANLSAKAIVGLAAYGQATNQDVYSDAAKSMAERWLKDAKKEKGSRLAFDQPESWSLKYNLIWDRLLDLKLFPAEFYQSELELYREKMNDYGMPLDNRSDYTKVDWLAWTTALTDDKAFAEELYRAIRRFISETRQRVPITDWYYSSTAEQVVHSHRYLGFQNRTVVGGLFVSLLD